MDSGFVDEGFKAVKGTLKSCAIVLLVGGIAVGVGIASVFNKCSSDTPKKDAVIKQDTIVQKKSAVQKKSTEKDFHYGAK